MEQITPAKCGDHGNARLVASKGMISLWAGKQSAMAPAGAVRLNLTGKDERPTFAFLGITPPKDLLSPQVTIDWPDMSIPAIDKPRWDALVKMLVQTRRPIFMGCGAGHGRTGTALVIVGCLTGVIPKDVDPVTWVRERYCPQAVESSSQVSYITLITGRAVTAKGSSPASSMGSGARYCKGKKDTCTHKALQGSDYCQDHRHNEQVSKGDEGGKGSQ